ncbi:DUF928 domain-containing protein [Nostoc sp. FACHB-110]|uniref:DUF928 domain-containing protein n=1 Tax=Nostoc sp. FACHB-110 TaxID=2692834 RepID=UPI00168506C3|nr:DUF928 domain-containing protein [Nostoc sp. FACHB-110]MBD2436782.1 DUF928 domain-containing protein [Nostoc sp. FACHB-110]
MNQFLSKQLSTKIISGILGLSLLSSIAPAQAQIRIKLPNLGVPGRRVPGGSRGENCVAKNQRLTALVPKSNLALTTVANPTLYFYIPENKATELELIIQDENDQEVYKQNYKPNGSAGVVGINLPNNTLATDKMYRWNFSIICNTQDRSLDKLVEGGIKRIENSSLMSKLEKASLQERLNIFAEAGIWQDVLDTLAQLRYSHPQDTVFKEDWESLLTSQGVEFDQQLAQAPLVKEQNVMQPIN